MHSVSRTLPRAHGSAQLLATLFARLNASFAARRSRRDLAALEPHQLADIGLSASQAEAEAGRPIWDVPQHWTR